MRSTHLFALATASLLSLSAQAAPVFYNSEAAFLTATSALSLSLESFQSYTPGQPPVTSNLNSGLNINTNAAFTFQNNNNYCGVNVNSNGAERCIQFTTPNGGSLQTFTFDMGTVNAFGIFLGDLSTTGGTTLTLGNSNGASQSYVLPNASSGNERYFGIVDLTTPFTSVTLRNSAGGDVVYIDNARWGKSPVVQQSTAVPEPGMLALLGMSFAGVALARRRRV